MNFIRYGLPFVLVILLSSSCTLPVIRSAARSTKFVPNGPKAVTAVVPDKISSVPPATCPVTKSQQPSFVPPPPYQKALASDTFWYGSATLWTALPTNGAWSMLPYAAGSYGQKMFWWRKGYNWQAEPEPQLAVTGRRLDAPAPPLHTSKATNAFAADIQSAMLVGIHFPTLGCWEITGQYAGDALSVVLWVGP